MVATRRKRYHGSQNDISDEKRRKTEKIDEKKKESREDQVRYFIMLVTQARYTSSLL